MFSDPVVSIITIVIGILGLLIGVFFTGRTIGEKKNGFVTQKRCDKNIEAYTAKQQSLQKEIASTNIYLVKIATRLDERT